MNMAVRKITYIKKNKEKSSQPIRFYSQLFFSILSIWIGIEFFQFINYVSSDGINGSNYRPPGVEGYLPISALMSLFYFLRTGIIHSIHPAGFFIFLAILASSFMVGKSFCSWVCPVGFLSELIGDFGQKFFLKKQLLPRWLDYPLRSIKYLILIFFAASIFAMTIGELKSFLDSDYNLIADIKLFDFFANISRFSIIVISALFLLSIFIRNFWCRYLCPYGALLGVIGLLSPVKIRRNQTSCIDCKLCDKVCGSSIQISTKKSILSDECTSCMQCVDICPVKNTLTTELIKPEIKLNKRFIGFIMIGLFFIVVISGMISGKWNNHVKAERYIEIYKQKDDIGH